MTGALSNGAKVKIFPNVSNPLFLFHLNVNYAQTRKSSITGNADLIGHLLDEEVGKRVNIKFENLKQAEEDEADGDRRRRKAHAKPVLSSSVLHSATPEAFFERCAADYQQIQNLPDVGFEGLEGRHYHGVLVNLDEAYDLLLAFGLLSDSDKPGKSACKNPHQSAFNKLIQYGQAARVTKSCGAYGQAFSASVTAGCDGNMHPEGPSGYHCPWRVPWFSG